MKAIGAASVMLVGACLLLWLPAIEAEELYVQMYYYLGSEQADKQFPALLPTKFKSESRHIDIATFASNQLDKFLQWPTDPDTLCIRYNTYYMNRNHTLESLIQKAGVSPIRKWFLVDLEVIAPNFAEGNPCDNDAVEIDTTLSAERALQRLQVEILTEAKAFELAQERQTKALRPEFWSLMPDYKSVTMRNLRRVVRQLNRGETQKNIRGEEAKEVWRVKIENDWEKRLKPIEESIRFLKSMQFCIKYGLDAEKHTGPIPLRLNIRHHGMTDGVRDTSTEEVIGVSTDTAQRLYDTVRETASAWSACSLEACNITSMSIQFNAIHFSCKDTIESVLRRAGYSPLFYGLYTLDVYSGVSVPEVCPAAK